MGTSSTIYRYHYEQNQGCLEKSCLCLWNKHPMHIAFTFDLNSLAAFDDLIVLVPMDFGSWCATNLYLQEHLTANSDGSRLKPPQEDRGK